METGVIQNSTVFQKNPSEPAMASPVRSLEDRDNTDKPASLPSPHDEYIKSENSSIKFYMMIPKRKLQKVQKRNVLLIPIRLTEK